MIQNYLKFHHIILFITFLTFTLHPLLLPTQIFLSVILPHLFLLLFRTLSLAFLDIKHNQLHLLFANRTKNGVEKINPSLLRFPVPSIAFFEGNHNQVFRKNSLIWHTQVDHIFQLAFLWLKIIRLFFSWIQGFLHFALFYFSPHSLSKGAFLYAKTRVSTLMIKYHPFSKDGCRNESWCWRKLGHKGSWSFYRECAYLFF